MKDLYDDNQFFYKDFYYKVYKDHSGQWSYKIFDKKTGTLIVCSKGILLSKASAKHEAMIEIILLNKE